MCNKNIHIELLGFPASGKSYFVQNICLANKNIYNFEAEKKISLSRILRLAFFILWNPKLLNLYSTLLLVKFGHKKYQFFAIVRFISRYSEVKMIRKHSYSIIDEGVVQAIWGLYYMVWLDGNEKKGIIKLKTHCEKFWPIDKSNIKIKYLSATCEEYKKRSLVRLKNHGYTAAIIENDKKTLEKGRNLMFIVILEARKRYNFLISDTI